MVVGLGILGFIGWKCWEKYGNKEGSISADIGDVGTTGGRRGAGGKGKGKGKYRTSRSEEDALTGSEGGEDELQIERVEIGEYET